VFSTRNRKVLRQRPCGIQGEALGSGSWLRRRLSLYNLADVTALEMRLPIAEPLLIPACACQSRREALGRKHRRRGHELNKCRAIYPAWKAAWSDAAAIVTKAKKAISRLWEKSLGRNIRRMPPRMGGPEQPRPSSMRRNTRTPKRAR